MDAGIGALLDTATANVGIRVASSVGGNLVGQGYSYVSNPGGFNFNVGSLVGSGIAGGFSGVLSVGGAVARAEGWMSEGVLGRLAVGAPGVLAAAGISGENAANNSPSGCGCH